MLAEDVAPSRLERAKQLLSKVIDDMVDDKLGLVVFAGEAFTQLPITCDYVSAKMFLNSTTPALISTQGTAIGSALQTAIVSFGSEESDAGRAIILITDGENHEDDAIAAARKAHEMGIQVFVIGIGKTDGAPIPIAGTKDYIKDKSGQVVVTRLNEDMCKEIAQAGNGVYVHCDNTNTAMRALTQELERIKSAELETTVYADYNEQFQSFVIFALVLILIEIIAEIAFLNVCMTVLMLE
jgi:Ca-activated chloride channel family protein